MVPATLDHDLSPARPRRAALGALLLALTAAPACSPPKPELVWTHDPQQYFSENDFAASFFSREVVLVTKAHDSVHRDKGVTALDPATGKVRWERRPAEWVLHPPGAARPLFVVNVDAGGSVYREAIELDPITGNELRRVAFAKPIDAFDARLALAGGKLLYLTKGSQGSSLGGIDLATGAPLWERPSEADPLRAPLLLPDRVIFLGDTYIAHALDDGRELFRVKGACCGAVASPDGKHLYVRVGVEKTAEVLPDGRLGASMTGDPAAASDRFVAVKHAGLSVYPHGAAAPTHTISAPTPDYTTAIALEGDHLFFFRAKDRKLWQRDLGSGRERAIYEVGSKLVVGPDANGVAPAHLSAPPVFDAPLLFVLDWKINAYRVP